MVRNGASTQWCRFLENDWVYCCIMSCFPRGAEPGRAGLSQSGLGSSSEVRSQWCERALPVVRLPPSLVSDVLVHQWLMSPLRTWLIVHLQRASQLPAERSDPRAAQNQIRAELLQSCCSFLESPGAEIQLASSPLWIMSPCWVYSPLFVFLLQFGRRFWREEILALPHLCHLCLCIWVRALIQ